MQIKKEILLVLIVVILGSFLRIASLDKFPPSLNHDEVTQLYDAISIAQTGKDVYGNFMPTIFESIHDFKPPFYTYATSLFYFVFGWKEFTVKITGALFGTLIIPAVYLFTKKFLKSKEMALIATFITAISPFEIFYSRKGFESGAGIFFILMGFYALMHEKGGKWWYLSVALFSFGMYTYFSHVIIIPLLVIGYLIINRDSFNLKKLVAGFALGLFLIIPLLAIILFNPGSRYRSQTVFILQDLSLGKFMSYEKSDNFMFRTVSDNLTIYEYSLNRYLRQFDIPYIFSYGLDLANQGLLGMGLLYLTQLPFLIWGVIYLIKKEDLRRQSLFVLVWILLGVLPSGLTFERLSPHRSIMFFTMLNIVSAIGIYRFIIFFKAYKFRVVVYSGVLLCFVLNIVFFAHFYTANYSLEKSESIQYPFREVAYFAWSQRDNYDQIIFDPLYGQMTPAIGTGAHYYFGYYGKYPPAEFQKSYRLGTGEREVLFDKFSIRKITWLEDLYLKKTLLIASHWVVPIQSIEKNKIIKEFKFFNGKGAFYAIKLD